MNEDKAVRVANGKNDPQYQDAVVVVITDQRASISNIQRRLKLGYMRTAHMVEAMESEGIVSAPGLNGFREVLAPELEKQQ